MMINKLGVLILTLCLLLGAAQAALAVEANWFSSYDSGSGTLQEAFDKAASDSDLTGICLLKEINNAAYTYEGIPGKQVILEAEGDMTAAKGASAITVQSGILHVYGNENTVTGHESCFQVNEGATLFLENIQNLNAKNGKPAIVVNGGVLELNTLYVSFLNSNASCDVLYKGGQIIPTENSTESFTIHNASGRSMTYGTDAACDLVIPSHVYPMINGQKVSSIPNGATVTLAAKVTVEFDANGGGGSMASYSVSGLTFTTPTCTFTPPEPDMVFTGWWVYRKYTSSGPFGEGYEVTLRLGDTITLEANWGYPVVIGGIHLPEGRYMDANGHISLLQPTGGYARHEKGKLTLHNFNCECIDISAQDITLILEGKNSAHNDYDALDVSCADVTIQGDGTLSLRSTDSSDDGIDLEAGSLYLKSGTVKIDSADHGIECDSGKVYIQGGKLIIDAEDDGIDSEDQGVEISGGTVIINAEDNGIDSDDGDVTISGGEITITNEDEKGLCPHNLTITGGKLTINAEKSALDVDGQLTYLGGDVNLTSREMAAALSDNPFTFAGKKAVYNDTLVGYVIADETGKPAKTLSASLELTTPPPTGDETPLAQLAGLMLLSAAAVIILRRKPANAAIK